MTAYRLVAYHKYETERESLELDTNYRYVHQKALSTDPVKYHDYNLVIENSSSNGETVTRFILKNGKFTELPNDYN